jgi:predicted transcriptional regulator
MNTLTLKIPEVIKEKLKTYARRQGISRSEIVRNALIEYFEKDEFDNQGTFLDLAKDLAGSITGPVDLSSNKDHLSGYGQ